MAINLTKFNFQEDLTSQTFNQKLTEIQTHLNNLSSANERLIRENQELRQLLNNKVENKKSIFYITETLRNSTISSKIQSILDDGYNAGQFTCISCSDMPFQDWGACVRFSHNEATSYLVELHQSSTQNVYFRYYDKNTKKWNTTHWYKYLTSNA